MIFDIIILFTVCWFVYTLFQIILYIYANKKKRYYLKSDILKTVKCKNGLILKTDNDIITVSESISHKSFTDVFKILLGLKYNKLRITVNDKDKLEYDIDNHVGFSIKRLLNTNWCKGYHGAEDFRIIQGNNNYFIFYSGLDIT